MKSLFSLIQYSATVHLNPVLTQWTLGPTWQVNLSLIASIISIASRWSQLFAAPPLVIKVDTRKHRGCRVYNTRNLWFHFLINKTAWTRLWGEKKLDKWKLLWWVAPKYSGKDGMCNILSQIISSHLRPVIWFCGFQWCEDDL